GGGPCQSDRDAGTLSALGDLSVNTDLDGAEEVVDYFRGDQQLVAVAFSDATRLFAGYGADEPLEIADAGLAGVVADDEPHRGFGKFDLLRFETVFLDLAWD